MIKISNVQKAVGIVALTFISLISFSQRLEFYFKADSIQYIPDLKNLTLTITNRMDTELIFPKIPLFDSEFDGKEIVDIGFELQHKSTSKGDYDITDSCFRFVNPFLVDTDTIQFNSRRTYFFEISKYCINTFGEYRCRFKVHLNRYNPKIQDEVSEWFYFRLKKSSNNHK